MSLSLGSDGMLCNTVEEVEKTGLEVLRKYSGLRVCSIGPLQPSSPSSFGGLHFLVESPPSIFRFTKNDINGDFRAEWLPEGFEERMTEKKTSVGELETWHAGDRVSVGRRTVHQLEGVGGGGSGGGDGRDREGRVGCNGRGRGKEERGGSSVRALGDFITTAFSQKRRDMMKVDLS
ncbi:Cytokinin-O-glucosyltransferase 1 [Cinnamomum micranthum f. kanehirae]|uniref:Cytokinin-O-glucosyltransferase 1 n=1 Tax=Cinnamomum micranthum f. kanehirae TaxID=337451 RepID=A0A3S4PXE4_9MAGN|nr:Cytokinin-O-glucosyltransferase 1 [Cinnamomum micranthum f. kanehirae]